MSFVPAPGYQPAYNPPVPFTTMIAGGLRVGMSVYIQAVAPSSANRFAVNFSTGQYEGSDVAFHLNARYDGRDRTVFNSSEGGTWGTEEMKKEMPFKLGKVFWLLYEITPNNYLVSVNGSPFYEFAHRLPMERVQWLQVTGDITLQSVCIIGCGQGVKGASLQMSAPQSGLPPMLGPPALNPSVPYTAAIRGGMIPKRTVVIKGIVNSNAKNFGINFKVSFSGEIPFHINPRINKSALIRNSFVNGTWGTEDKELATKFPFKQGDFFDLSIRSGVQNFKVFINGSHCFNFEHRYPNLQNIDTLEVNGDVKLCYVHF
ncbi:galectin-6 [Bombina bombina]|uniref:galectin-6 n=1 Tax=Bombina bombina TaxID=8345 RepID=UPI00235B0B59|nr:galectin-6 [Bombina bombina]